MVSLLMRTHSSLLTTTATFGGVPFSSNQIVDDLGTVLQVAQA